MAQSTSAISFKLKVDPQKFIREVDPQGSLRTAVESAKAIIAPRDISKLMSTEPNPYHIEIRLMHNDNIERIFRKITDDTGDRVYEDAVIDTGRITPKLVYHGQTFAQAEKIVSIGGLQKLLDNCDSAGISKTPASVIEYNNGDEKYVALYFPAIVEKTDKELIIPILDNLRKRAKDQQYLKLDAFENGHSGLLDLRKLVSEAEKLIENKEVKVIEMLRDGAHRSHVTNTAGTTMHAIVINGARALPTGVPIKLRHMIVTNTKPQNMEDRYLGYAQRVWMNYKDFGIDG